MVNDGNERSTELPAQVRFLGTSAGHGIGLNRTPPIGRLATHIGL